MDYEVYTQLLIPKKSMILPQSKIREHTVEYVEAGEKVLFRTRNLAHLSEKVKERVLDDLQSTIGFLADT
jgi:hypothetical protein